MATQETKNLDSVIASRRSLLMGGGAAALAAAFMPANASAASTVASYSDNDILNFALNLEYLEANFYWLAAFGTTIDKPNAASTAVGQSTAIGITAGASATNSTQGTVAVKANPQVPFTMPAVKSYAVETAIEESKHVTFLRTALGAAAVAQPAIDLSSVAWNTLATAATVGPTFDPFASDVNFLVGAYVFEDVGVTAYSGAAPLISTSTTGKGLLQAAASILAVEAYHAGLIRTTIQNADPTNSNGYLTITQKISGLRATLSRAALSTAPNPDDVALVPGTQQYNLAGTTAMGTTLVDADLTNVIAFSRNTTQVLNIVTGGNATTTGSKAKGVFFPAGLNGTFS